MPKTLATCVHPCKVGSHFVPNSARKQNNVAWAFVHIKVVRLHCENPPYRMSKLRQLTNHHTVDATSGTHCSRPELNVTQACNGITGQKLPRTFPELMRRRKFRHVSYYILFRQTGPPVNNFRPAVEGKPETRPVARSYLQI